MIRDTEKYIDFLCKTGISPTQYLLCYLLENKSDENIKHILNYKKSVGFDTKDITALVSKGYLEDFNLIKDNVKHFNMDCIIVTPKFKDLVFVNTDTAYQELNKVYPGFAMINGSRAVLKAVDFDATSELYLKRIGFDKFEHETVLQITAWAKSKDLINMRIDKYIDNKMWRDYEELMKEESTKSIYGAKRGSTE